MGVPGIFEHENITIEKGKELISFCLKQVLLNQAFKNEIKIPSYGTKGFSCKELAEKVADELVINLDKIQKKREKEFCNLASRRWNDKIKKKYDFDVHFEKLQKIKKILFQKIDMTEIEKNFNTFLKQLEKDSKKKDYLDKYVEPEDQDIIKFIFKKMTTLPSFFDSVNEEYLSTVAKYLNTENAISRFKLDTRFGVSIMSIYISLHNALIFAQNEAPIKDDMYPIGMTSEVNKTRLLVKKYSNYYSTSLGSPIRNFFNQCYSENIKASELFGGDKHAIYYQIQDKNATLVDIFNELKNGKWASARENPPDLSISPPKDWEDEVDKNGKSISGDKNFSGISDFNKENQEWSLVNKGWIHEHILIPTKPILQTLNFIQKTPLLVSSAAFNYYFSKQNPEYISTEQFELLRMEQKNLSYLQQTQIKQEAQLLIPQVKKIQIEMSKYYEQQLISNAIISAQNDFMKAALETYSNCKNLLNKIEINALFEKEMVVIYCPCGLDFRKRLISRWRVHYLNSKIFRYCLTGIYSGIQEPTAISATLGARGYNPEKSFSENILSAKNPISLYALKETIDSPLVENYNLVTLDAVSSGAQHNQLYINEGMFSDELYFNIPSPQSKPLYATINQYIEETIKTEHTKAFQENPKKILQFVEKYQVIKNEKNFAFKAPSDYKDDPDNPAEDASYTESLAQETRFKFNAKKYRRQIKAYSLRINDSATILSESFNLSQDTSLPRVSNELALKMSKWMTMLFTYGSSAIGIERYVLEKLSKIVGGDELYHFPIILTYYFREIIKTKTRLFLLKDLFKQIARTACRLNIDLFLPCPFGCQIRPQYRYMKSVRIARRVPLYLKTHSHIHRIRTTCSLKMLSKPEATRAFPANLLQQRDADCIHLLVLEIMSKMNPDYPFFGILVHDSISFHSQFQTLIRENFRLVHYKIYILLVPPLYC